MQHGREVRARVGQFMGRKTGAHQESRAGEGHDEPRLRERVRQRHLREKDAEKVREKAAREDRGKVGEKRDSTTSTKCCAAASREVETSRNMW